MSVLDQSSQIKNHTLDTNYTFSKTTLGSSFFNNSFVIISWTTLMILLMRSQSQHYN